MKNRTVECSRVFLLIIITEQVNKYGIRVVWKLDENKRFLIETKTRK